MSEESGDLPFKAEYAKSGRSSCKMCKSTIDKAELRLAVMVQSPMFDGKVPNWHHVKCFFQRNRPKSTGDIGHFDALRWEDQEKLTKMVANALAGIGPSGGKGGSKSAVNGGISKTGTILKDFRVEVAKSGGAGCRVCEQKITKGLARIGKKDYESQRAKMYGPYDRWHHVECFIKKREELEFFDSGENLAGFKTLGKEDQQLIKSGLKELKSKRKSASNGVDEPDSKKPKMDDKEKEALKKQMKKIYYYRDMMESNLSKKELVELLEFNDQEVPSGVDKMLDRLSDVMMFGALEKCKVCGEGQFVFRSGVGYQCLGNMSEWTKCQEKTLKPQRKEFKLPKFFRETYDFCKLYKYKEKERIIPNTQSSASQENGNSASQSSTQSSQSSSSSGLSLPLKNLTFVIEGKLDKDEIKQKIEHLGGKVGKKVTETTAAVISTSDYLVKNTKNIALAKQHDIQVVSEKVLDNIKTEGILSQIKSNTICEWGSDPKERLGSLLEKARHASQKSTTSSSSMFLSQDMPKSMKLKLKGGAYVDPESGLDSKAHVLKIKNDLYSVVLGAVNIQEGKNSYYKLQLLKHDVKNKFYIFRSWGRVGTTIGGSKVESFGGDREDALALFQSLYEEKTGNMWRNRHDFQKVPGKFFPMDLDMGEQNNKLQQLNVDKSKSKLDRAIQELVALIFDIDSMKKALVEFEIDLTKMPLGKLSRKQIESAYKILTEAHNLIRKEDGSDSKFLDASNRFFTLIPHDFGMNSPPLLNDPDIIKSKIEMLDNLLEIEVAYNLLKTTDEKDSQKDPIDIHYKKLQTNIEVLDRKSEEFKILERYVKNTHAATHNLYTLKIEQIFKIARKGEKERFAKYENLGNRMLLWHGSRTTNYAGILSQGLRIAPPEAPVTGYMFGKGIYFADMVSKSANYCQTSRSNNTGLMLLCDVALGEMYERTQADYIEKLPKGKHSTKGVGSNEPDPNEFEMLEGKVKVPFGKGTKAKDVKNTSLLYNEYIIYDVKQCNAKYLFRMKFDYKL